MFQRFGRHCAALFYVSLFSWTSLGTVSLDLTISDPVAVEAGRSAQIHLGRKGDTSRPATVSYSINSISSTGVLVTDDLVQATGQLIFEPGQTNAVLMIEAKHDGLAEDVYEYFDFVLTQIDGDDLGDPKRIKLQVIDAETAVRRHPSFQPLYSVNGFGGLLKLADGSLLVAGDFGCDDRGCFTLRKLKPNGELDRNVRFDRALNVDRLDAIYETADAIVLGGRIILDRIEQNLVRISKTGQVDRSFSIPEGNNRFAGFQPDGRAIMIESGTNLIRCDLDG